MPPADSKGKNEAQVREVLDRYVKAIGAKDVDAAMACLAPDVVTFNLAPPLQHPGSDVIKQGLQQWFPTWQGPIEITARDLRVTADDQVAFCTSLQRMTGTKVGGDTADLWYRATTCLRKIDGTWRIAHEHTSTPFYMDGSNKAALDLKP